MAFQRLVLCSIMRFVMVVLRSLIIGLVGSCLRVEFLCWMRSRMFFGKRRFLVEILPFGMNFLSAARMMLVMDWFAT